MAILKQDDSNGSNPGGICILMVLIYFLNSFGMLKMSCKSDIYIKKVFCCLIAHIHYLVYMYLEYELGAL